MRTYRGRGAKGVVRPRPGGTPLRAEGRPVASDLRPRKTGFWRREDGPSSGRRCEGRYSSSSSSVSGADGTTGATAQALSTLAEIKRRIRMKASRLICDAVHWL